MDEYKFEHLYHIVAASGDQMVIGENNQLPWPKISEDLKFFKTTTAGSTVIMGRKTFESIGKPLPGRENFVLSRSDFKPPEGVKVFTVLEDALKEASRKNVFIIGGGQIFNQTMDKVDKIYFTHIKDKYFGDTYYPQIPESFKIISRQSSKDDNVEFIVYENTKKSRLPERR